MKTPEAQQFGHMTFQLLPQQVNREGLFGEKGQLDMVSQSQFQVKDRGGPEESEQLALDHIRLTHHVVCLNGCCRG